MHASAMMFSLNPNYIPSICEVGGYDLLPLIVNMAEQQRQTPCSFLYCILHGTEVQGDQYLL